MYPNIGPKTAERLALFTIQKMSIDKVNEFSDALKEAVLKIKKCKVCGNLTDKDVCEICQNTSRDNSLMIVEEAKDVIVFEKMNHYNGKYHVLGGKISPLNGVSPEDVNLGSLKKRIIDEKINDVIIATGANIDGEMTAMYIKKLIENMNIQIYRIGYGLPAGADIEYADEVTLMKALEGKTKM